MASSRVLKQRAKKCLTGTLLVVAVVLLVRPVRNVVLSPFLPGAWLPFPTWTVLNMVIDTQHLPMGGDEADPFSVPRDPVLAATQTFNVTEGVAKFMYTDFNDPFRHFDAKRAELRSKIQLQSAAGKGQGLGELRSLQEELDLMESFEPVMSRLERAQLIFTLHVFTELCRRHGIFYFMFEGSLLGAYRHHGLVPWDDDVDLALNVSQWQLIQRVLGNVPGFTLFAPADSQWKFYLSDLKPFQDKPFKFPYLDLFFFRQTGDMVWGITWGMKNHLMLEARHLLPLTTVRWEALTVAGPACAERMAASNYGLRYCSTPTYVHKTNQMRYAFQTPSVPCSRLHPYLPFVFRVPSSGGGGRMVVERLMIGGEDLSNFTRPATPEVCQA